MAKLVVLKKGSPAANYELKAERTTIGRMDDNAFQIDEPSVSSHHCEVLMQGNEFVVKDLNSTNGTFLAGEKVTESKVAPGQILRLGEVEVRLETEETARKQTQQIRATTQDSILKELKPETRNVHVDQTAFAKKSNKADVIFIVGGSILALIIIGILIYALFLTTSKTSF